jgi:hypothetical protein
MIKLFRKIRHKLLSENKFSKYLIYAVGEIILVVIGILIALQINNWNTERENEKLRTFYMQSLVNDLAKDTVDINRIIRIQKADLESTQKFLKRIHNPTATIDTIIKMAKKEYDYSFIVKRDYANNTFNTIISSGNIELLDKELVDKLMDLNGLQIDQLERFYSHIDYYQNIMSDYMASFPIYSEVTKNDLVDRVIWNDINEKELIGKFTAGLGVRLFMFKNTISGHLRVKEKSIEIISFIENTFKK